MAQFDANVNLRVNVKNAERQLKKFQDQFKKAKKGELFFDSENRAAARTQVRTAGQILDAQKEALRIADAKVRKDLQLTAAYQRQETLLKAINRAGGPNSQAAKGRIDAAVAASKEAKRSVGIQQAVNNLLVKELQIRREINRVKNASNEAKSVGNRRGREIQGFKLPAAQEKRLLKLNAAYVQAAEKGQADIAKAINRKVETEVKGIRKAQAAEKKRIEKKRRDELRAIKDAEKAELARQKKLDKILNQQSKKKKKRGGAGTSGLANNLGAAVGFPLLFGGGVGSVGGGVLGALGGSLLGAGFGGSIVGSALGQQLDKLAAAADKTAQALRNPIDNLNDLVKALGITGTALEKQIQTADKLGLSSTAALIAQQEFERKFGSDTAKVFNDLGKDFTNFNNDLAALGIAIQKLLAGPLGGLLRAAGAVARTFSGNVEVQSLRASLSAKDRQAFDEELGGSGFKSQEFVNALIEKYRSKLEDTKDVNKAIGDEYDRQQRLLERQTAVVEGQLVNRRDTQAALQGSVAVLQEQNKLAKIQAELDATRLLTQTETTKEKIRQLEVDKKQTEEAKKKAEAAKRNAEELARRQIESDAISARQAGNRSSNNIRRINNQFNTLTRGSIGGFSERMAELEKVFKTEKDILELKQRQEAAYVKEAEVLRELVFQQQNEVIELENKQQLLRAQEVARQAERLDRQQAIKDARELRTLEAEINAERLKRATDPEYMLSFAGEGLGFFSRSAKLEADQIADRTAKLELYNEQLAKLKQRQAEAEKAGASKDFKLNLANQVEDLEALRNNFERLQPEIDAAALAQARFNDAFNAVSPAVNSLVNGLKEVVAGTKSAEEAFADFLNTIANQLVQTAATMIAQYIAIGIARSFAGIPGPKTPTNPGGGTALGGSLAGGATGITPIPVIPFAEGGYVTRPTRAVIGEGGEPEYVIPASKMNESMARYSGGNRGNEVVPNNATGGGNSPTSSGGAPLFDLQTTVINNVEYATVEDVRAMGARATSAGAKQGEARVMSSLKNSRSMRSRVGI